jgi:DNA mismatch repair protein MutS
LVDVSTGEFLVAEGNLEKLLHIVHTFDPAEIIYQRTPKFLLNLKIKTVLS